jgi:hypothetical protein
VEIVLLVRSVLFVLLFSDFIHQSSTVSLQQTRLPLIFMQMLFCETAFFYIIIHSDIKSINNTFLN